jgi:hypothetical protein
LYSTFNTIYINTHIINTTYMNTILACLFKNEKIIFFISISNNVIMRINNSNHNFKGKIYNNKKYI